MWPQGPTLLRRARAPAARLRAGRRHASSAAIAYQGVPGAFSEAAVTEYFASKSTEAEAVGVPSFERVLEGVEAGDYAAGVLPIEDSITGSFHGVYDLLVAHPALHVVGEHAARTEHCLCAVPGVGLGAISSVASNPEILRQCGGFLEALSAERRERGEAPLAWLPALNSAECALELGSSQAADAAVICSEAAAQLYGLSVVEGGDAIADSNVSTRYVVVSTTPAVLEVGERMKVSIVFALPNEPLALLKAISVFALRDINVSKIESRPASATGDQFATAYHWDYVFYMDLELPARYGGVAADGTLDSALANLEEFSISVRELGRYAQNLGPERAFKLSPSDTFR